MESKLAMGCLVNQRHVETDLIDDLPLAMNFDAKAFLESETKRRLVREGPLGADDDACPPRTRTGSSSGPTRIRL